MENHSLMPITRNMIHQRLALNDVLDIIITTHLPACKHTVGLDNPGYGVGTSIPVYQS